MRSTGKTKKQRRVAAAVPRAKSCCGTLNYLAECRGAGAMKKADERPMRQVFGAVGTVRKLPAIG
ncbi:MAG: hypothetical protein A2010_16150 [Nitrospirae bacterium GWD2_57_9]|nr:MAG: hypothetical protein A2010_16150 [Nitrospirae bacterium GWD2_57_9]OGW48651.1 MAG: hypothetical protein A2078_13085 [Nitrospirae bacterium GWC2_57_9]